MPSRRESTASTSWAPHEVRQLMVVVTGCLCLLILLVGILLLIEKGVLTAELLGSVTGLASGGGLLGLALVVYLVIRTGVGGR